MKRHQKLHYLKATFYRGSHYEEESNTEEFSLFRGILYIIHYEEA